MGDEEAVEVVPGLPSLAMEMVALHADIDKQVRLNINKNYPLNTLFSPVV